MQTIKTKHFGPISFIKTWVSSDGRHIGKLSKGGYTHLSGSAIASKKDLTDLIPSGSDRKEAIEWFDHKDEPQSKVDAKKIMLTSDGGYMWEDGSPIEEAADIYNTLPKGRQLEAVLAWFQEVQDGKRTQVTEEQMDNQRTTEQLKKERQERMAYARSKKKVA